MSMVVPHRHRAGLPGEPLTWYWLLAHPALALQAVFNIGMGLSRGPAAALSSADDFSQLLPFLVRTWL